MHSVDSAIIVKEAAEAEALGPALTDMRSREICHSGERTSSTPRKTMELGNKKRSWAQCGQNGGQIASLSMAAEVSLLLTPFRAMI
jgi:hypothetical protein